MNLSWAVREVPRFFAVNMQFGGHVVARITRSILIKFWSLQKDKELDLNKNYTHL